MLRGCQKRVVSIRKSVTVVIVGERNGEMLKLMALQKKAAMEAIGTRTGWTSSKRGAIQCQVTSCRGRLRLGGAVGGEAAPVRMVGGRSLKPNDE